MVKRRKTIALDEDIVNRIAEIARSKGISLTNYLRRLFLAVIKAEEHGLNPEQALLNQIILKYLHHVGITYTPITLLRDSNKEWKSIGYKLGVLLKVKNIDRETAIIGIITNILSSIGETTIEKSRNTYRITCISNKVSKNVLNSIALMIEELAKQYNTVINKIIDEGILVMEISLETNK